MDTSEIQRLVAQSDIINTLNRFVLSVDQREWNTMRDCLTDDVNFDYSALNAVMPKTADALVEQVQQDQSHFKAVQHTTTNHYISIEKDKAYCTANVRAQHLLLDEQCDRFWTVVGRYVYQLLQTQTGWKICGCTISVYWTEPNT